ncbi:hypothetical protein B1B_09111, partial [mine drainage metagenome]
RRVLARHFAVDGDPGDPSARRLWALSDACTPNRHVDVYTQAVMDLGQRCARAVIRHARAVR